MLMFWILVTLISSGSHCCFNILFLMTYDTVHHFMFIFHLYYFFCEIFDCAGLLSFELGSFLILMNYLYMLNNQPFIRYVLILIMNMGCLSIYDFSVHPLNSIFKNLYFYSCVYHVCVCCACVCVRACMWCACACVCACQWPQRSKRASGPLELKLHTGVSPDVHTGN